MRARYDYIFSLGQACSCTENLRKANLQLYSLPFDWLFGSDMLSRAQSVANGFDGWFEMEDFDCLGDKPGHRFHIYRNRKTKLTFNHDFPVGLSFDDGFPAVRTKYMRRINRLLMNVRKSKKVCAVYVEQPYTTDITPDDRLVETVAVLRRAFPGVKMELLYVHAGNGMIRSPAEGVRILSLHYKSKKPGALDYQVDRKALSQAISSVIGLVIGAKLNLLIHKLLKK